MILYWNGNSMSAGAGTVPVPQQYANTSLADWPESIRTQWRQQLADRSPAAYLGKLLGATEIYQKSLSGQSWSYMYNHCIRWATAIRASEPNKEIQVVLCANAPHWSNYVPLNNNYYIRWAYDTVWLDRMQSFTNETWNFLDVFEYDRLLLDHMPHENVSRKIKQEIKTQYAELFEYITANMETMYTDGYADAVANWLPQVNTLVAYLKSLNIKCFICLDWWPKEYAYPKSQLTEVYDDTNLCEFFDYVFLSDSGAHPSPEQNSLWAEHLFMVMNQRSFI